MNTNSPRPGCDWNELSCVSSADPNGGTRKRNLILLSSMIPVVALFVLLGWDVLRSGGNSRVFGVNSEFGEVTINQSVAPEFIQRSFDGETVSLSGLRGKVVMVDFWSSWCPPCRQEAPTLAQIYREYEGKNIEFIGVIIWDTRRDAARYIEEYAIQYPNIMDESGEIAINYGVVGIPEKFFIDANGNLIRKFAGPMQQETLRASLDELLGTQVTGPKSSIR